MQQIFFELEHKYSGYMIQVESLLWQCIVKMVRNYENALDSRKSHFSTFKSGEILNIWLLRRVFLYDYETITLENLSSKAGSLAHGKQNVFLRNIMERHFFRRRQKLRCLWQVLLADKSLTITAIAERLNYSSVEHFSYAFKQYLNPMTNAAKIATINQIYFWKNSRRSN